MQPTNALGLLCYITFQSALPLAPSAVAFAVALTPAPGPRRRCKAEGAAPFCRARAGVYPQLKAASSSRFASTRGGPPIM